MMIEEAYVSFKTAKLLKEKGFIGTGEIGSTCGYYEKSKINGEINLVYDDLDNNELEYDTSVEAYLRTTQQMAMRWLREEKNIVITIDYNDDVDCEQNERWGFSIYSPDRKIDLATYPTYEEAVEAALKYCLTNFI